VDDEEQLSQFLASHPVQALTGGENAYPLDRYLGAFRSAGLRVEAVLDPWDSVINAFPQVRSQDELARYARSRLRSRLGPLASLTRVVPALEALAWMRIRRPTPGRMYTFLASS
jgi:hypothetical protein